MNDLHQLPIADVRGGLVKRFTQHPGLGELLDAKVEVRSPSPSRWCFMTAQMKSPKSPPDTVMVQSPRITSTPSTPLSTLIATAWQRSKPL
ncbi:hypothetical protein FT643_09365 [Ketobacter sp. MCCC 1A13808]|uniref:hypothetical protein n=1 Tax=Ketobacter sp. MCCC 1A13808 TaxID=2602738 RepID=UPI0012EB08FF|nr:hypothetical protein [Ketobacter sp. MCCC 1A13808]MVF12352.1 hypothetical protein [Ketobacter sp. MCCC 1A13808]